jgi:hypothetical protein
MFHALRRLRDRIEREGGIKFEDLL